MSKGELIQGINQVIQVRTNVLCHFRNLLNAIQNVDGLRVRIVTDGEGTLQVPRRPFTDFFLGGAEGFGDKVERLEGGDWVGLSGSLFRVKGNFLRLVRQRVLQQVIEY